MRETKPVTPRTIVSELEFEQDFSENVEDHTFMSDLKDSDPNNVKPKNYDMTEIASNIIG